MGQNKSKMVLTVTLAVLFFAAFTASVASAECIEIGTGTGTERYVPFYGYYDYGWSKIIYTQSELNNPCVINKIAFNVSNTPSSYTVDNQKIYMAHTTESHFSSNAKPDPSTMTLVYDGSITWDGSGWHNITLDSTFSYNNVDNLLIYYENRDGSYASGYPYWYYTSKSNRAAYKYQDSSFPETPGTLSSYVPNIRFYYTTTPKTLSSLTGVQASTDCLPPGSVDNPILRLDFEVTGTTGTLNLTEIKVTSKNTDDADIAAGGVEAFITSTHVFSTANQFGSGASFASSATISGTLDLLPGTNYLWVTYDIAPTATLGNLTDAKILANDVTVNASTYPAAEIDPAGNCPIGYLPVHNLNTDEYFRTIQAAIDDLDTVAGHTITVEPGTYTENVDVDKSLTLKSSSGSYADTIVNAADTNDHVFEVTVNRVNISGFTATGATGNSKIGISLNGVQDCNISKNNASNNYWGIYLTSATHNTVTNNLANTNTKRGITLYQSSNFNTVANNICTANPERGIRLFRSCNNNLTNNTASHGAGRGIGIRLESSSNNNNLFRNTANSNWYGVYLRESNDNNLTDNTANSNDDKGIYLYKSTNNILTGNTFSANNRNFGIFSWDCSEYVHDIDATNLVDGKPIYYLVNEQNQQVPSDAGFVGVVNSINITVKNATLTKNGYGVLFACTSNSRIENVDASGNDDGIFLLHSNNNLLLNNNANSNTDDNGIYLYKSNNNRLTKNTANANNEKGIWLYSSSNNNLANNTASYNDDPYYGYGIFLSTDANDNSLTNNTASNNGEDGICLYEGSNRNTLTSNTASANNDDGIYLVGSSSRTTNDNTLTKNTVDSNAGDGIFLKDSQDNNITCNLIVHNKGNGIHLDRYYAAGGSIGNTIEDNNIVENGIYNSGTCGWEWNFYNEQDDNVAAENNYWAAAGSAFIAAGIKEETGTVDYEPFFNDPAPCAPTPPPLEAEASIEIEKWVKFKTEPDTAYRKLVDHVNVSDNLTFKIVVQNDGINSNLTNLTITDLLDCCLGYVVGSATPPLTSYADNCPDNQTLTWRFPALWLETCENRTVTFEAQFVQSVDGENRASATAENATGHFVAENDTVQVFAANPLPCTCGDICVNPNGWWRAGSSLHATSTPIQDAINNAVAGETVCVKDGTYNENVEVNEQLTIKSENGSASTIVQAANPDDDVFELTKRVNISGFTVKDATGNGKAGIYLHVDAAAHSIISNNNLTNNYYGVHVYGPDYLKILNNTANSNTKHGFYVRYSVYSNLSKNTANSNGEYGFYLYAADYNNLSDNTANLNTEKGILLSYSDYNDLTSNIANSNYHIGIYVPHSNHNNLTNNTANSNIDSLTGTYGYGICVCYQYSDDNNIVNNTANSNGKVGIYLYESNNNNVENNIANSDTIIGIRLYTSSNNNVTNNTVSNNSRGISLESSSNDNIIYNNYFENANNAWDDGSNDWNISKTIGTNIIGGDYLGGNYWSDYAGEDSDGDGLGDTLRPYNSSGNITDGGDWHPLVPVGAGAVLSIEKSDKPDPVLAGGTLNYSISVNNTGNATATNVTVIETYDENVTFVAAVPAPSFGDDTWQFPTLNVSETRWINVSVTVNASVTNGTVLHNFVNVSCDESVTDTDTENTTVFVAPVPVLEISKTDAPDPVSPGGTLNYTISVNNTGNATATNVTVIETYDENVTFVAAVPAPSSGDDTWQFPTLNASETRWINISVIVNVSVPNGTVLHNIVNVSCDEGVTDTDTENTTVFVAPVPVLEISKTDAPDPVSPGGTLNYTISVNNTGNATANNVTVIETYDKNVTFVAAVPAPSSGDDTWQFPTLNVSETRWINVSVIVNVSVPNGTMLHNIVNVSCDEGVTDTDTENTTVFVAPVPVLEISKTDAPDPVSPGGTLNYTISVNNTGNATANNVTVIETYDKNVTFVAAVPAPSSGDDTWQFPTLNASETRWINVSVTVNASVTNGTVLHNFVNVSCDEGVTDTDTENTTVFVAPVPVLEITKTDAPDPVSPGGTLNYTISVNNTGNATANNVTVKETYDENVTFVAAVPAPSSGDDTWQFPTLNVSETRWINISVTVNASVTNGTVLHNFVNVSCDESVTDTDTENTTVFVAPVPVLEISKTDAPDPVSPGGTLNYTISVNNTGNATATNVTVIETYDKNVTFVAAVPAPSFGDDTWQFPTLNVSETRWINVSVTVNVSVPNGTVLHNIVNVSCDEGVTDTDTENTTVFVAPVPVLEITKTDAPDPVSPGGTLNYTISVNNTGNATATNVTVIETYDKNVTFVAAVPAPSSGDDTWQFPTLNASETRWINISVTVNASVPNGTVLHNIVNVSCDEGVTDTDTENTTVFVAPVPVLEISKTDAPDPVSPGGTITYTINYANVGLVALTNVTITEKYPEGVTFISAVPAPDPGTDNIWPIGTLPAGASGKIVIKVKVPDSPDLSFTETGSVTGEGFVMVSKDLSTEQKPYRLKNVVTITCAETDPVSASAVTTVSGVPGTSLEITEHGSGIYESEEILNFGTKNKSIRLQKSTDAEYQPTSFNFSDGFSVVFTNMWMQDICSKNMILGDAMHKKIKDATYIKDETKTETGEYGTEMEFASSFQGAAHIGAVSKDVKTSEDYIGEFEIFWAAKEECQYLFNWSRVPGNDSEKLIRFLVDNPDIKLYWAENATITKSDDDRIINISTDWHSAEVILAANNETATVKVGNETIYVLDVRTEDGSLNLNVYDCRLRKISESVTGEGYVMVDKELASGHIQVVEHGSGIYTSDTDFDSQRLNKSTEAEYQPTTFNFSDGFDVNFSSNWMQGICSKDKKAGTAIHKKISNAASIADDTTATKSSMAFETSFNGSIHVGARTEEAAISEDYIGRFNVSQVIKIGDATSTSTSTSNTSNSSDMPSCP